MNTKRKVFKWLRRIFIFMAIVSAACTVGIVGGIEGEQIELLKGMIYLATAISWLLASAGLAFVCWAGEKDCEREMLEGIKRKSS